MRTVQCICKHTHWPFGSDVCGQCKCTQFGENPVDWIIITENGKRRGFEHYVTGEIKEVVVKES